jgi:drug/metabolite transporter (DMT)-like permease
MSTSVAAQPATARWVPAFLATAVMWGTSFYFIKIAVRELPPVYVTLGRIVFGASILLVLLAVLRLPLPRGWRLWGHLAVLALFTNTVPFTLFAYAEQRVSSVLAGIWNGAAPLTTLAVTLLALPSERPTRRRVAGLLIGFAGVLVVLGAWHGVGGASLTGQLMLFGAVTCYGVGFNYVRWMTSRYSESGVALSAGQLTAAAAQLAVVAPLVAGAPPRLGGLSWAVIGSVAALGVFGSGLAFVLNYHVVRVAGVTTASMVTYLPPVIAAVVGVALLGEKLTWNQPVGGLVVLGGVAIAQGLGTRPRRRPREPGGSGDPGVLGASGGLASGGPGAFDGPGGRGDLGGPVDRSVPGGTGEPGSPAGSGGRDEATDRSGRECYSAGPVDGGG